MNRIKLRNPYTFKLEKKDIETPTGKSLTIENEALSITEILNKWTHGIDPMLSRNPLFMDDTEHEDPDMNEVMHMDVTDRAEVATTAGETYKSVKEELKKSSKKKEETTQGEGENGGS